MGNRRILIVEDDDNIREVVKIALEQEGYEAVVAANGEEAKHVFEVDKPSLVVLDLIMPVMDGIQFLQYMQKEERLQSIPVVVMTASNEWVQRIPPGIRYIKKPFSLDVFLAHVKDFAK